MKMSVQRIELKRLDEFVQNNVLRWNSNEVCDGLTQELAKKATRLSTMVFEMSDAHVIWIEWSYSLSNPKTAQQK